MYMYVYVYVHAFTHNAVATNSVCAHAYLWHANVYPCGPAHISDASHPASSNLIRLCSLQSHPAHISDASHPAHISSNLIRSTYPNPEFEFLDNICGRFLKLYKESLQNRKKVRIWGGILVWRRRDVETFAWCKSTPWRREVWGQYSVVRREVNGPTAVGALH